MRRATPFHQSLRGVALLIALSSCTLSPGGDDSTAQPEQGEQLGQTAEPMGTNISGTDNSGMDATVPARTGGIRFQVQVETGLLVGEQADADAQIRVFRGIPYAEPPVGPLRWRPPRKPLPWTGAREATRFSASCVQERHTSSFVWRREDFAVSEDCLYLNIWSPASAQKLPVMVWFHGGAHVSGQGHSLIFDGTRLAGEGVVLV
ncbi:MAG: carboxylesterase family protein, partial [Pseudomonadota bacterium]